MSISLTHALHGLVCGRDGGMSGTGDCDGRPPAAPGFDGDQWQDEAQPLTGCVAKSLVRHERILKLTQQPHEYERERMRPVYPVTVREPAA